MIPNTKKNKELFTRLKIEGADKAQKLQQIIGWTSNTSFEIYIGNNLNENVGISVNDINRAELIYCPESPLLQGKMIRQKPPIHDRIDKPFCLYLSMPTIIMYSFTWIYSILMACIYYMLSI